LFGALMNADLGKWVALGFSWPLTIGTRPTGG
jgi:hypothetical protein